MIDTRLPCRCQDTKGESCARCTRESAERRLLNERLGGRTNKVRGIDEFITPALDESETPSEDNGA